MASGCSDDDRRFSTESRIEITTKKDERIVFPETKTLDQGQSFFRMFSIPRHHVQQEEEPKEDKILPPSQPMLPPVTEEFSCDICGTIFRNKGGRTRHRKTCAKKREVTPMPTENIVTPNEPQVWGEHTYTELTQIIDSAYEECVKWKRNLFMLPTGRIGNEIVDEMTRLIDEWINDSPLKQLSLKALMIMPCLLLQKPSRNSKSKDNSDALKRRFQLWKSGDFDALIREARYLQSQLSFRSGTQSFEEKAKRFNDLMLKGKIGPALRLLNDIESSGVLNLTKETLTSLQAKHPNGEDRHDDFLLRGPINKVEDYVFQKIDGTLIRKLACQLKGAAGPSTLDADGWRRILTSASFGNHSMNLCDAIAKVSRKLCHKPDLWQDGSLEPLLSCRLIPLDKNPGVRPIAIGEVLRRLIGKSVVTVLKPNVLQSVGDLQLCGGQKSGCEAAVHAMRILSKEADCDGILLVDADNAFNRINRRVMIHNVQIICPEIATFIGNTYSSNSRLSITGGYEINSSEGTAQGDPVAMPLYALALVPLLENISSKDVNQVAYADDLTSAGQLESLLGWWTKLQNIGPYLGYFPKGSKSWLVVKSDKYELAKSIFKDTNINITKEGKRHLGAAIGSNEFKDEYVANFVKDWINQLKVLSEIAKAYPQSAYCAFTAGFIHKFNHIIRTIPDIKPHLQPLEDVIRHHFIPALCEGRTCNDHERQLLSLPVKLGGLGIINVLETCELDFQQSVKITRSLVRKIVNQNVADTSEPDESDNVESKTSFYQRKLENLKSHSSPIELKAIEIASSTGASAWLSSLPIKTEEFSLTKREFFDAIYLRYCWDMKNLPSDCVCGSKFSVDHALQCKVGGFIHMRHNELVNITANLSSIVCKDVEKEPILQKRFEHDSELRADITLRGFWQRQQKAFLDVRVFSPSARSYQNQNLPSVMRQMEKEKKRKYLYRVLDQENGTFTPLVFSANGGMSKETKRFYARLSELLSEKNNSSFSETYFYIKRKISFSLIRSAVVCLRGSRSWRHRRHSPFINTTADAEVTNCIANI